MNVQIKKNILEFLVLLCVAKRDMYGYELANEIPDIAKAKEATIYSVLKPLTKEKYFETYLKESTEGR